MSQIYEVVCKACAGVFDLPDDPGKLNWICECQRAPPTPFKRYWIACGQNPRHRMWSNRAIDCPICQDEKENKRALITIKHEGVKINGQSVPLTIEKPQVSISQDEIKQMMVANSELEKKERDLEIISLLEQLVKQKPEIIANELREDK